jgi:hypothetical protein
MYPRGFPADHDEAQYSVFGTNEWTRVVPYPDGTPCIVEHGQVTEDGISMLLNYATEYDFFGNVLSRFNGSHFPASDVVGGVAGDELAPSSYWRGEPNRSRIVRDETRLTKDFSAAVYHYQESDTNLMVGAWVVDRRNKRLDKLVFGLELANGKVVTAPGTNKATPNVRMHLGALTKVRNVAVAGNEDVLILLEIEIDGKTRQLEEEVYSVHHRAGSSNAAEWAKVYLSIK